MGFGKANHSTGSLSNQACAIPSPARIRDRLFEEPPEPAYFWPESGVVTVRHNPDPIAIVKHQPEVVRDPVSVSVFDPLGYELETPDLTEGN